MDRKPLHERKGFKSACAAAQERHRRVHNEAVAKDEARMQRCPVCGGLNPGDATHTRCA